MLEKINDRKRYIHLRDQLSLKELYLAGNEIKEEIIKLPEYSQCKRLFAYMDIRNEVPTWPIIESSLSLGIQVFLPKVTGPMTMTFFEIRSFEDLIPGKFNILEPSELNMSAVPSIDDIVLIPGVAFTKKGERLGYGGGYYDSYLAKHNARYTIGICYDFQVTTSLIQNPWDIRVNRIISVKNYRGL